RSDHVELMLIVLSLFFFSSRRRHTRSKRDWSSDVCSSDLTVRNVSNMPSSAKNASGSATRRTTEQKTSPSFHCAPASSAAIEPRSEERRVGKEQRAQCASGQCKEQDERATQETEQHTRDVK